jgi:murein DD-endopeptidase MepM/ murein hydrolase activator NlpD
MFNSCRKLVAPCIRYLRSSYVLGGALTTWLVVCGLGMPHSQLHASELPPNVAQLLPPLPSYVEKPFVATSDVFGDLAATSSSYFRTLKNLYSASAATSDDVTLPPDEMARFHQMDTRMPIALARITSHFGHRHDPFGRGDVFHRGIDMAAPVGTSVQAVAGGTVMRANKDRHYGNVVVIDHHNGYHTLYAHNSKLLIKAGERVKAGETIAKVGSTGRSTGPHLHFEIHRDGKHVDPSPYLARM